MAFALDPKLDTDTHAVCDLDLCTVRLMNDSRFPWLILVPKREGLVELIDLEGDERRLLTEEIDRATRVLREVAAADKMNVAALGNSVRQLHIHVIARHEGDLAWPGPVWGAGQAEPYGDNVAAGLIADVLGRLDAA
ncbi:MAG: HIT domain-containing protein [Rhodospirillales bacterium]|nr:HIT domain-containing protein [Rhodospirillales bacterium]